MRTTLKDIAEELQVSTNTVSKALNHKAKVSEELRAKIIETARRLGYEKNTYASRLSQKPITIGVLINGYDKNYYQYTLRGFQKAERQLADCKVFFDIRIVEIDSYTEENSVKIVDEFVANGVQGIIFNDCHFSALQRLLDSLNEKNIYAALLNYDSDQMKRAFSMTNDYEIAAGLACDIFKMKLDIRERIILYSQVDASYSGKCFLEAFSRQANEHHFKNITIASSRQEFFDVMAEDAGGIYVAHACYLEVCSYLKKHFAPENKPCLVVSDIYEQAVPFVEDGTIDAIIYQKPQKQAFDAALAMYHAIFEGSVAEEKKKIIPLLLLKSNYQKYL